MKSKKFIEEQIAKTHDALTRDRLYSMYGQEVEKEMTARTGNRSVSGSSTVPGFPTENSSPGGV